MPTTALLHSTDTQELLVAHLTIETQTVPRWNEPLLREMWPLELVREILAISLGQTDTRCWLDEPACRCSYKAIFKFLQSRTIGSAFP